MERSRRCLLRAVSSRFLFITRVLVVSCGMTNNVTLIYEINRCSKLTCVICSRKCEGPSSLPSSTNPDTTTRPNPLLPSLPPRHIPRKTMPLRRRPLHTNAGITNQKNLVENSGDAANSSVPQMWPRKHDMRPVGAERSDTKSDVCSYGTGATFCKSCVKEDIVRCVYLYLSIVHSLRLKLRDVIQWIDSLLWMYRPLQGMKGT